MVLSANFTDNSNAFGVRGIEVGREGRGRSGAAKVVLLEEEICQDGYTS